MSASAINPAPPQSPGSAAGNGAGASQPKGQLAGFEALLATFFGVQPQPGVAVAPGKTAAGKTGATPADGDADGKAAAGDVAAPKTPEDIKAAEAAAAAAAALAACNTGLGVPPTALPIATAPAPTGDAAVATEAEAAAPTLTGGKTAAKAAASAAIVKGALATEAADATAETAEAAATPATATVVDPTIPAPRTTAKLDLAAAGLTPPTPEPTRPASSPPPSASGAASAQAPTIAADLAPVEAPQILAIPEVSVAAAAAAGVKVAEQATPAAPVAAKDKAQTAKAGRSEHSAAEAAPATTLAKAGAPVFAPVADGGTKGGTDERPGQAAIADTKSEAAAPAASADAGGATTSTTNALTQVHPGAVPVRGSPQTVANLAAQIAKKLEGRSSRFDLELNPAGLGRVDVRMEIGASGRMSAAMTFDTPAAAAELRARAGELQRHLEQAGFDLSGGLSFDVAGDRGQGRQTQQQQADNDTGQAFRGRAFKEALATADGAAQSAVSGALNLRRSLLSGVDVRI